MAFYTPMLAHNGYDIVMLKATSSPTTDGNWSEQDGSVRVETGGGKVKSLWSFEHSSDIYIATQQETDGRVRLHIFDPGTDTWTTKNEFVSEIGDHANFDSVPVLHGCSLAVRSDGDIVVVFTGHDDTGTDDEIFCRSKTTTWGSVQSVSNDAENPVAIGPDSSDRITFVYGDVGASDVDTRSISSTDVLGTEVSLDDAADTASLIVAPGIIDSGNEVYVPYIDASNQISVAQFTSAADPTGDITIHADVSDNQVYRSDIQEQVTSSATNNAFGGISTTPDERAQSFQYSIPVEVSKVDVVIATSSSPPDSLAIELREDSSGEPTGTLLGTVTIEGSIIPSGATLFTDLVFDNAPISLSASTTYWLVFTRTGALSNSHHYHVYGDKAGNNYYTGGTFATDDGSWVNDTADDAYFSLDSGISISPVACLAVDGTNVHLLYANDADRDIYHDDDVENGGTTDDEDQDAVTGNRMSCAVLGTNLDYVWLDGTTIKYNSIDISGAAPAFLPNGLMLVGVGR